MCLWQKHGRSLDVHVAGKVAVPWVPLYIAPVAGDAGGCRSPRASPLWRGSRGWSLFSPARPGTIMVMSHEAKHREGYEGLPVLRGAGLGADVCRRPRALRKRVQDRVRAWEG